MVSQVVFGNLLLLTMMIMILRPFRLRCSWTVITKLITTAVLFFVCNLPLFALVRNAAIFGMSINAARVERVLTAGRHI